MDIAGPYADGAPAAELGMGMGAGRDLRRCVGEDAGGGGERERTGDALGRYPCPPGFDKAVFAMRTEGT